jgi:peptide/nickel transport system ATP-binding protein
LLSSVPSMDPSHRTLVAPLAGDPPNPINPPTGCRFHPRCPQAAPVCAQAVPAVTPVQLHHAARCLVHESGSGHPLAAAAALAA